MEVLTNKQMDAVLDAQDARTDLRDKTNLDVAAVLKKEGHPAWKEPTPPTASIPAPAPDPARGLEVGPPMELAPLGQGAVAEAAGKQLPVATAERATAILDAPAGMEGMDQDELVTPFLGIKQAQTKDPEKLGIRDVPNGHWFTRTDPESNSKEREVVFLEMKRGRQFLLPYEDPEKTDELVKRLYSKVGIQVPDDHKGPVCYSMDRLAPEDQGFGVLAESCSSCAFANWRTVGQGARKRRVQDCGESYLFLLLDVTEFEGDPLQMPAILSVRSSGIRPCKSLLTNLVLSGKRHKLPMCGFRVTLSTKEKTNDQGVFFVPTFGRPVRVEDPTEVAAYEAIRNASAGWWKRCMYRGQAAQGDA